MSIKQVIEMSLEDFEKGLENKLSAIITQNVLSKYAGKVIDTNAACQIIGVHKTTLYRHVKANMIEAINHEEDENYKFDLLTVLNYNPKDARNKKAHSR